MAWRHAQLVERAGNNLQHVVQLRPRLGQRGVAGVGVRHVPHHGHAPLAFGFQRAMRPHAVHRNPNRAAVWPLQWVGGFAKFADATKRRHTLRPIAPVRGVQQVAPIAPDQRRSGHAGNFGGFGIGIADFEAVIVPDIIDQDAMRHVVNHAAKPGIALRQRGGPCAHPIEPTIEHQPAGDGDREHQDGEHQFPGPHPQRRPHRLERKFQAPG